MVKPQRGKGKLKNLPEEIAHLSHDIRSPLSGVLGLIEVLLKENLSEQERADYLERIRSSCVSVLQLADSVLESYQASLPCVVRSEALPVREFFADTLKRFEGAARLKSLRLSTAFAPNTPTAIQTDHQTLLRITNNLIDNALKFTPQGEIRIETSLTEDGRSLQVDFVDQGIGIAPENHARLFRSFSPLYAHQGSKHGMGLGLALCRTLSQKLGGNLFLAHSELLQGSRFRLILPVSV